MRIILFLLIFIVLNARENPFVPVITNNLKLLKKRNMFKEKNITLPSDARILKSVTFTYQTLTGSIKSKTITINKAINWHNPIFVSQTPIQLPKKMETKNSNDKKIAIKVGFLNFYIYKQKYKLFINSQDKMIRHFVLVEPFRVVLDFKGKKSFLSYSKKTDTFIKKIVMGNHDNYYRVVLYTDGVYKPVIKEKAGGYSIDFK